MTKYYIVLGVVFLLLVGGYLAYAPSTTETPQVLDSEPLIVEEETDESMSFFLTSANPGQGGDLGGIAGADAHCTALAVAAGSVDKSWRAYLSTTETPESPVINARDRIGSGPWRNSLGEIVASNVEELHATNNVTKVTALSERGVQISGRGDTVNMHDILTGSDAAGMAQTSDTDTTCSNWTSSSEGSATVGHHDRVGLDESDAAKSWNSSHGSRGCSLDNLKSTGGNGLFYCFAE